MVASGSGRPVVVLDVLGTLVDQAGSLQVRLSSMGTLDTVRATAIADTWLRYVTAQEESIVAGRRAFAPSHELDREAVYRLVDDGSRLSQQAEELIREVDDLTPWPDSVAGLETLSRFATVFGLSNASRRVIAGLSANAGFRWHQVLSAEDAATYKPDLALYELAVSAAPSSADPPMMVAAHAWDLRAAARAGMRTAYVPRPHGDAPLPDDAFDIMATGLQDFCEQLAADAWRP